MRSSSGESPRVFFPGRASKDADPSSTRDVSE